MCIPQILMRSQCVGKDPAVELTVSLVQQTGQHYLRQLPEPCFQVGDALQSSMMPKQISMDRASDHYECFCRSDQCSITHVVSTVAILP